MIPLEYHELKQDALDALGELYRAFTKRVDMVADKAPEDWAAAWKSYRAGDGNTLADLLPTLPDWVQITFAQFGALQRFAAETQKAFESLENDISQAYTVGLQRGRSESDHGTQDWRQCKTAFDRARLLDKIPYWQRFTVNREVIRYRSKEIAAAKWPELFTIQNDTQA